MKPGTYNLPTIWIGADYSPINFTWLRPNGDPIDLTTWFPFAMTRDFSLNPIRINPAQGVTQIILTKDQTRAFSIGVYQWNFLFQNTASGVVTPPLLSGIVEAKEPVTFT